MGPPSPASQQRDRMGKLVQVTMYKSAFLGHRSIATYLQRVQSESALIQRISTLEKMMAAWNGLESLSST